MVIAVTLPIGKNVKMSKIAYFSHSVPPKKLPLRTMAGHVASTPGNDACMHACMVF